MNNRRSITLHLADELSLVAVGVGYLLSGGKTGPILNFLTRWTRPRRSVLEVLEGGRGKRGKKYVN